MHACEVVDADKRLLAAVDYYFIQEDGKRFKVFVPFLPYFYIKCKSDEVIQETSAYLSKKFGGLIRGNLKMFYLSPYYIVHSTDYGHMMT
jgi:DNA polymerase epsilon subunit 1